MKHVTIAVAVALTLSACGGGGDGGGEPKAQPSASVPGTTPPTPVSPDAQRVRDAVAKTLADCPCAVSLSLGTTVQGRSADLDLKGVYDAESKSATLRATQAGLGTIEVRTVGGATYMTPEPAKGAAARWLELDFAALPKPAVSEFSLLALADPGIAFALAGSATSATFSRDIHTRKLYDSELDVAAAVEAAGPSGDLLRRLLPNPSVYEGVQVDDKGRLYSFSFTTTSSTGGGDDDISLFFTMTGVGVKGGPATKPAGSIRKVDVATFTG